MDESKTSEGISWTASEFIAHEKTTLWYIIVMLIAVILAIPAFFFADVVTATIIIFVGIMFCIVGARKPRELPYQLTPTGIKIDKKFYPFANFKSFSVIQEEGIESVWFLPLQRFAPGLSIYYAPDHAQMIYEYLSEALPFEPRELDFFDSLMHRIRF